MKQEKKDRTYFSIITVTFNDLYRLKQTAKDIFSQVCQNFEWIVIDGKSTDGTVEFLKQERCITKWISENDSGIYDAMNKGIDLSTGKYIVFMNAGDYFSNSFVLDKVKTHLDSCGSPDVLFGGATLIFRSGVRRYRGPKSIEKYIWHGLPAIHQATYYKRSNLQNIKYDISYKICGDYYIVAKLFNEGVDVSYLDLSLVEFSIGGLSYQNPIKQFIETFRIQKKVLRLSIWLRCMSLLKRFYSITGLFILSIGKKYGIKEYNH